MSSFRSDQSRSQRGLGPGAEPGAGGGAGAPGKIAATSALGVGSTCTIGLRGAVPDLA